MATYIPQKNEDAPAVSGDLAVPVLGVRNDVAASKTDNDGDYSALATDAAGRVGIADLGGSITVDGSVSLSAVVPGTGATNLGKAEDAAHTSGDVGVMALGVANATLVDRAADSDYVPVATTKSGAVAVAGFDLLDSGELVPILCDIDGTVHVALAGVTAVGGDIAHDSADSGLPVKVGGKACATSTAPTPVANADRANLMVDDLGRVVVVPGHVRDLIADITPLTLTSTTTVTDLIAADANNTNDLLSLVCVNISSTGTEVIVYNDDGTTVRWGFYVPGNDMRGIVWQVPLKAEAVNKKWKIKTVTSVASLKVYGQYVKNGA